MVILYDGCTDLRLPGGDAYRRLWLCDGGRCNGEPSMGTRRPRFRVTFSCCSTCTLAPAAVLGQWDLPYGWAPLGWIAVDGMNQCGDHANAERMAQEFPATIRDSFQRDHMIREKYNVVTRSAEFQVTAGYQQNVACCGWTTAFIGR